MIDKITTHVPAYQYLMHDTFSGRLLMTAQRKKQLDLAIKNRPTLFLQVILQKLNQTPEGINGINQFKEFISSLKSDYSGTTNFDDIMHYILNSPEYKAVVPILVSYFGCPDGDYDIQNKQGNNPQP